MMYPKKELELIVLVITSELRNYQRTSTTAREIMKFFAILVLIAGFKISTPKFGKTYMFPH